MMFFCTAKVQKNPEIKKEIEDFLRKRIAIIDHNLSH
jgi:hypothetical protein